MKREGKRTIKSTVVLAKFLSSEGFSDHLANEIERYYKANAGLTKRQRRQIESLERSIAKLANSMEPGDRLVMGRFIGLHKKMSFDTGLRMGLMCFAKKCETEIEEFTSGNGESCGESLDRMESS
jgi:hypothetical protein